MEMSDRQCVVCAGIDCPGLHPGHLGRSPAPNDLMEFIDGCKARGLRGYKGEFVASDGTRVSCEFMFERPQERRRDDDG